MDIPKRCMLLQTVVILCISCKGSVYGQSSVSASTDMLGSALPESPSSSAPILLPTPTPPSNTPAPSATPPSTTVAMAIATPVPLKQYVIILGVTTGVFLVTTILSTTILVIICCRKLGSMAQKEEPTDAVFNGSPGSSHWITQPSPNQQMTDSLGVTSFPIWSTQTFSDPVNQDTQRQPTITINGIPCENTESAAKGPKAKSRIKPKRVAPPPPKGKKHRKKSGGEIEESAVYDVPASSQWYSRKRRPSKLQYKELNLKQVQAPGSYAKPQTAP